MARESLSDTEIKLANERYRESARGFAKSIKYRATGDLLALVLQSGVILLIPRSLIIEFKGATPAHLRAVKLIADGGIISCEPLDVDISVPGLVRELTATATWLTRAGKAKSPEKAAAARANGAKGGRPRKAQVV